MTSTQKPTFTREWLSSNRVHLLFVCKASFLSLLLVAVGAAFFSRYFIGVDPQEITCLPYHFYLVDKDQRHPVRGGLISFRMDNRGAPFFKPGERFIKMVMGVPGDHIAVTATGVFINGKKVKVLSKHIMKRMGKTAADFERKLVLKPGQYWVMGTHPWSFDSTYWGEMHASQVIGTGTALW